ncbi:thiamine pyrophosphate-dependent dehydrogenase E1 component subunit alpha [Acetobacterium woodii]|nr:thiamine pyrophosphate-dependent dehydrogenase E1 component subunit alpha [Acetobacterium woodii]
MIELSEELLLRMYYKMNQSRYFEEKLAALFSKGKGHGNIHLAIGQEATGVISCLALEEGDLISLSHRSHAQAIGFGLDVNLMMAECLGKVTGYCKGKGGSMHIADVKNGNLGANGIVGGGFNLSCGAALTQKHKKTGKVVLCFAGDSATNGGNFHESLNLASVWKLPVVFLIENNLSDKADPIEKQMNVENIADRSDAYNMPGLTIDGNDFLEVYNTVVKAVRYARAGKGPVLVEAKTTRYNGQTKSHGPSYQEQKESPEWRKKDPILKMKEYLRENRIFTEKQIKKMEDEAMASVEQALEFAMDSPQPQLNAVLEDVYAREGE